MTRPAQQRRVMWAVLLACMVSLVVMRFFQSHDTSISFIATHRPQVMNAEVSDFGLEIPNSSYFGLNQTNMFNSAYAWPNGNGSFVQTRNLVKDFNVSLYSFQVYSQNKRGAVNAERTSINNSSNSSEVSREKLWGCYEYRGNRLGASRSPADREVLDRLSCAKRPPDAILIGVKKCGSQTLTGFLDLHPEVVSDVYPVLKFKDSVIEWDIDDVIKRFPLSTASELTFIDMIEIQDYPESLGNMSYMAKVNGTKFFLILVDPIQRARSDYVHVKSKAKLFENEPHVKRRKLPVWDKKLRKKIEPNIMFKGYRIADTFEKSALDESGYVDEENELIRKGMYEDYIEEILKYIPRENLFVLDGEAFIKEPWIVLGEVEKILGVSAFFTRDMFEKSGSFYCPVLKGRPDADCLKGKGRKKRQIEGIVRRKLGYFYRPKNSRLRKLLGQAFLWK